VQPEVEPTGVAHGLPDIVPPPQGSGARFTVGARPRLFPPTHQSPGSLDDGPVGAVHLVVEAAGVAEVVARAVAAP
ncbi:unnamed protein product, partial [Ixodes pacificus]